jgi:MFS family permease
MNENIDLKTLEKKAYRSVFNDGIWDIFVGLLISNLGIGPLFNLLIKTPYLWVMIIPTLGWNIMALMIFMLGKKYITTPRVGYVKFGPERKSKQLKLKVFLMIMFIINLLLLILPTTDIISFSQIQPLLLSLLLGFGVFTFPFSVIAYYLDFTRLYYYSFSAGLGFFLTELLTPIIVYPLNNIIIFGTLGLTIVLIGLYFFIQFLKKYSFSKEEVS